MRMALMFVVSFVLFGCDQSVEAPPEQLVEAQASQAQIGTVLETIDVESYTYIRLYTKDGEIWLASNPVSVSEGDVVGFAESMLMENFHSKALDRTFERVLFVSNLEMIGGAKETPVKQAASPPTGNPHDSMTTQVKPQSQPAGLETAEVQPLEGGVTIATIFADRENLEGQDVRLRAKVIKFSPNVLGKNWVTLLDGTGTPPDNTLVVTSSETVDIGEEVIVGGRVKNNVDIGAGYSYKVLLEEASFIQ